ncbi:MAG: DNA repair protein RecO [Nitrospirae bacterium]|nr:DNA repair protein RecO [Nitrospirota bacterium]
MPLIETEAIVLNSLRLGEADKLVTFYSHKLGKIKAVAKGARKLKNKYGSSLEPFTYGRLVIYDKNSRFLYRLFQSDIIESFQRIRCDYDKILQTAHFSICVESLSPEGDPCASIFSLFLTLLNQIKSDDVSVGAIHLYKLKLLGYSGYELFLDRCVKCHGTNQDGQLSPFLGGMVCLACASQNPSYSFPVSLPALAILKQTFKMDHDLILRIKPTEEVIQEISHLIDVFIFHLLGKKLPSI